uniref:DNA-directed DNA polymerase n=1 Tax=Diadromus pulchellus ascovirus 4a TaxID=158683 RepID=Q9DSV8_9VIRU|nr:delta DNA polymerase [Diadromus pulchellus ascovirus 4a]
MSKRIEIFSYYWKTREVTDPGNFHTQLRIYGIDRDGRNTCVLVDDCKTRLIVEFTDFDYLVNNFKNIKHQLEEFIFNRRDKTTVKLVYKSKLYGAYRTDSGDVKKFPYVEVVFSSRIGMLSFKKKVTEHAPSMFKEEVKFHQCSVGTEILFMIERDCDASGWLNISNAECSNEKLTLCENEYRCKSADISRSDRVDPVDVKIMAWDIEARCKNIGKDPDLILTDCVYQISCVFWYKDRISNHLLTLGPCSVVENATLTVVDSERDLIVAFAKLIQKEQPNIITGWNIFTFDFKFMINRADNMCMHEFTNFGMVDEEGQITTVKWSSKAFSATNVQYVDVEGVLCIDLIEVVRKDYKLDSYSLNNVSKHFLKNEKDDMNFQDIMKAIISHESGSADAANQFAKLGHYCVQDSRLVLDLFLHLQTWLSLSEMSKTTSTPIMMVHLNGQQKKFYNQVLRYCWYNDILVESNAYQSKRPIVTPVHTCSTVPGLYEYVVPLDFASLYPSIMIAYNLDYSTIVMPDSNVPEEHTVKMEWEDHCGCEHDPLVVQKRVLETLIETTHDKARKREFSKKRAEIIKKINKKPICQPNSFRFIKQEVYGKGVLPTIIQTLLDARKSVRAQMKNERDPNIIAILNQRQLSYKVSANSMYGATGVRAGALPFMPIAMCVTFTGRQSIIKASNIIKSLGGTIVYGDTDSNYITFDDISGDHKDKCEKIWTRALETADQISCHYPKPMKIEFEETIYYKFMILTKKRYMYYSCKRTGEISKKIGQKGVLLARRDHSQFVKQNYETTVMNVFASKSKEDVISDVFEMGLSCMRRQLDDGVFRITKAVNDYDECRPAFDEESGKWKMGAYAVPAPLEDMTEADHIAVCIGRLPAQVQLEVRMVANGFEKPEGARMEYIVLKKRNTKNNVTNRAHNEYRNNRRVYDVDYMYYISHLVDPLEQIIFEYIQDRKIR